MPDPSMTPVPSSPVALLDQLDELRANATPGPWRANGYQVETSDAPWLAARANVPADAALIVAAVNAVGPLTAAVRAVLELADELDRQARDMESVRADAVAVMPADPATLYADAVARNVAKEWTKIAARTRTALSVTP